MKQKLGAPRSHFLAVLALAFAAFAATSASASAATLETSMGKITAVSYSSARVTGKLSTPGGGFGTNYSFQYSKNPAVEGWTTGPGGSSVAAESYENKKVLGVIRGLKGGTKYYVRFVAQIFFGPGPVYSPEPYSEFTTLPVDPPTITGTVGASPAYSLSAHLVGKVKRPSNPNPAFDVTCRFEYVTDAQYGSTGYESAEVATCGLPQPQNPITEPDVEKDVTAQIGCIHPFYIYEPPCLATSTTYHVRLVAENASPDPVVKEGTFTTEPMVAQPAVLTVDDASDVGYREVKTSGSVERPAGPDPALDTYCFVEYVTEAQFVATGFAEAGRQLCDQTGIGGPLELIQPLTTAGPTPVTKKLIALQSGVTYHLRIGAENAAGLVTKDAVSTFSTLPGGHAPTHSLDPDPAPIGGYTTIQLFGNVDRGLGPEAEEEVAAYNFEFAEVGTENWSGVCCFEQSYGLTPFGAGPHTVSLEYTGGNYVEPPTLNWGIKPDTEYKYRFLLQYPNWGEGQILPVSEPYPTVTTKHLEAPTPTMDPVTTITKTTAEFSAAVDTNAPPGPLDAQAKAAYKTEWHFECSPECPTSPGLSGTVQGEVGTQAISAKALRLQPNTYYEVKLVARNAYYTEESAVQIVQTPLVLPDVQSLEGFSDGEGGYTLQGIVNSNNTKVSNCRFEYGTTATYPNTYVTPCLPSPSGPDEVQKVDIDATSGQFKLSVRGQTTGDLDFNATAAEVQTALRALSTVGAGGATVSGTPQSYEVKFLGKLAGTNVEPLKPSDGTTPLSGGGGVNVSILTEGGINHPVTVEARLEGLTLDANYHFRIFVSNIVGSVSTADRIFVPTKAPVPPPCPNEALRQENNSLSLPECRAFEMVTDPHKEGFPGLLIDFSDGDTVRYISEAPNIENSGTGSPFPNSYTAVRTAAGWKTLADLNGPSGSFSSPPENVSGIKETPWTYSKDLLTSLWAASKAENPGVNTYLRGSDGRFVLVGTGTLLGGYEGSFVAASADLHHVLFEGTNHNGGPTPIQPLGMGIFEWLGHGQDNPPHRLDLDNLGNPIGTCELEEPGGGGFGNSSKLMSLSEDGRVIFYRTAGGCGLADNPPANELWARVDGTTSYEVSASHCTRTAGDPGGACNAPPCTRIEHGTLGSCDRYPTGVVFGGAATDGSRAFFTTAQQLVNGDVDETKDLYACDIPSGTQAPVGKANPCAPFRQISDAATGAEVENVHRVSEDGSTVYFTAKGVLADNEDAFGETALPGNHNLYVWRQDAAHPSGQTTFIGMVLSDNTQVQLTADGHYAVLVTPAPLVPSDTDTVNDVYRYDADAAELVRVSTGVFGSGGNAPGFDASIASPFSTNIVPLARVPHFAITDDGQKIVFSTREPLSARDANSESDIYLWRAGEFGSLITQGSIGGGGTDGVISGSGQDIYFDANARLIPGDVDFNGDVYDARVGGGFTAAASPCTGESCQAPASTPPAPKDPPSNGAPTEGNVKSLPTCPKGKVRKHGRCVKKHKVKKHHGKKKAAHTRGGGK